MKNPHGTSTTDAVAQEAMYRPTGHPGQAGLLATYAADNGTNDVVVTNGNTNVAEVDSLTVTGVGNRFIINASLYFLNLQKPIGVVGAAKADGITLFGGGSLFLAVYISENGGPFVPVDSCGQSANVNGQETLTRAFEIPAPAGSYVIQLNAGVDTVVIGSATVPGSPPGSGVNPGGRLVVEVVGPNP